jgi:hypothetical protein
MLLLCCNAFVVAATVCCELQWLVRTKMKLLLSAKGADPRSTLGRMAIQHDDESRKSCH